MTKAPARGSVTHSVAEPERRTNAAGTFGHPLSARSRVGTAGFGRRGPLTRTIAADQFHRVDFDRARVPGWNEIDAVELVGRDGSRQWATSAKASSSYAGPR